MVHVCSISSNNATATIKPTPSKKALPSLITCKILSVPLPRNTTGKILTVAMYKNPPDDKSMEQRKNQGEEKG